MRLNEIDSESRKVIKRLHNLYMSYSLDSNMYIELLDYINQYINSQDLM